MRGTQTSVERTLTLRELNRALLARQLLLERSALSVPGALEHLVGLQAQIPSAPYVGLWTRLRGFERDDLARLIEDRKVVKAALMRGTLHFFTAEDYVRHRATIQPVLSQFAERILQERRVIIDVEALLAAARAFIAAAPRTFAEISAMLAALHPEIDVGGMRHAVRMRLPLVQVPVDGKRWSYPGSPRFALAEAWIGRPPAPEGDLRDLVFRYLRAFGPASVADIQAWGGFTRLKEAIDGWRGDLRVYADEQGRELFDMPGAPLPDPDTPAPVRFIPELDNLLIGHQDRQRIIRDEYRPVVMKVNAQGSITFLVDGFVRGVCRIEKTKQAAALVIEPFEPVAQAVRAALVEEGEGLLRFVEPEAKSYAVRFAE